ncbi:MAG: TIGR03862 family flavoprotein [Bacteroidetes bacterium]|nr:TIGR03862 family flavoprotein [Bacteroidota bacterium]
MKKITIIGSGPAALLLAAFLDGKKFDIHIYEKNSAPGRKFLVAGDGGFNLTHSENIKTFVTRYTPEYFLKPALLDFTNEDLRKWLLSMGIATFIGTSKRIFPEKIIKPIDVLNAIFRALKNKNVRFHFEHEWRGWKENKLLFHTPSGELTTETDHCIFSLGGASWKVTGSDGTWAKYFEEKNIAIVPFQSSNCTVLAEWQKEFIEKHNGKALKNILVKCNGKEKKGEIVITSSGLEGGAVYFLSPDIRRELSERSFAEIFIDLRPDESETVLLKKLRACANENNRTAHLRSAFHFKETQMALLKNILSKEEFLSDEMICNRLKNIPVRITALAPIDEAISTVGGIAIDEVNENFELKKLPHHFVIGEMLDWDAPTGGYLLQACFSMGVFLARHLNGRIDQ